MELDASRSRPSGERPLAAFRLVSAWLNEHDRTGSSSTGTDFGAVRLGFSRLRAYSAVRSELAASGRVMNNYTFILTADSFLEYTSDEKRLFETLDTFLKLTART